MEKSKTYILNLGKLHGITRGKSILQLNYPFPSSLPLCTSVSFVISLPVPVAVLSKLTFKKMETTFLVPNLGISKVSQIINLISNSKGLGASILLGGIS